MLFVLLGLFAEHREFAHVMFLKGCVVYAAGHRSTPFGSVASVQAWHRIGWHVTFVAHLRRLLGLHAGSLIKAVGRRLLKLAIQQYVDDYIGADREESIDHASAIFVRFHSLAQCLPAELVGLFVPGWLDYAWDRPPSQIARSRRAIRWTSWESRWKC